MKAVSVVVFTLAVVRLVWAPLASNVRYTLEEKPRPVAVTVTPLVPAGNWLGERNLRAGLTITG